MNAKDYAEANRKAWNQVNYKHQAKKEETGKYRKFEQAGYSTLDHLITEKLLSYGLRGKDVAHVCCNDGEETLSLKNLGARKVVGFDISDNAIESARLLSKRSNIEGDFIQTDIYDISKEYNNSFDMVYISVGSLIWFPDILRFFRVINRILKINGHVLIYDIHPFLLLLDEDNKDKPYELRYSYFKNEPLVSNGGLDYLGKEKYESVLPTYNFDPTFSQIVMGLIKNKISLQQLEEYNHDISSLFGHLNSKEIQIPKSFFLSGEKICDL